MKHRNEIIRFKNSPEGTKVWCKYKDSSNWFLTTGTLDWENENLIYIVDDDYAEVRKAKIDGKPIQWLTSDGRWLMSTAPFFSEYDASRYRVAEYNKDKAEDKRDKYMVFVEHQNAPKKIHDSFESAKEELKRLLTLPHNVGYKGYVVKIESTMKSKIKITEVDE